MIAYAKALSCDGPVCNKIPCTLHSIFSRVVYACSPARGTYMREAKYSGDGASMHLSRITDWLLYWY